MSYVCDPINVLDDFVEYLNGMLTWVDQDGVTPSGQRKLRGCVMHSVSHESVIKMRDLVYVCVEALCSEREVEFPDASDTLSYLTFNGSESPRLK